MQSVLLLILDGWGQAAPSPYNAISNAQTPQWDRWQQQGVLASLNASGQTVGLPTRQMGNSEVGHMHIGAGRVIKQELTRISDEISNGDFFKNPVLINAIENANKNNANIHILGLVSDGGVHSHVNHLYALLDCLTQQNFPGSSFIHAFLDGRDTAPNKGIDFIADLESKVAKLPNVNLASLCGRFYAMDRDKRWDRVKQAYDLLTSKKLSSVDCANAFIRQCYEEEIFDEFIPPTHLTSHQPINNGDLVIFFNFRADRARELSQALTQATFNDFNRTNSPLINLLTMTEYAPTLNATSIYKPQEINNTLGECIQHNSGKQLRIAETEKYAHVTFFLNGGREAPFDGEERLLIPSPKVKTYDLKPEMSAFELTEQLVKAIESNQFQLIVCNFANADMVGHTGNYEAAINAIEALDQCFIEINRAVKHMNYNLVITADHGNAEKMFDEVTKQTHTAHTNDPVPFLYIGPQNMQLVKKNGSLSDIAPTILQLMHLKQPVEMTGSTMLKPVVK